VSEMREMLYTLDGHEPVEVTDVIEWARWFQDHNEERVVAYTCLGSLRVSTVFLAVNYSYLPGGVPILFETMVFSESDIEDMRRYATWEQAEIGHAMVVSLLETIETAPT